MTSLWDCLNWVAQQVFDGGACDYNLAAESDGLEFPRTNLFVKQTTAAAQDRCRFADTRRESAGHALTPISFADCKDRLVLPARESSH